MYRYISIFTISLLLIGCYKSSGQSATSGQLSVCVTEACQDLLRQQADEFQKLYPGATISLYAVSTREAMVDFINDSIKVILVDRAFNTEEHSTADAAQMKYQKLKIAEDAFAIIVSRNSTLGSISKDMLQSVLEGSIADWERIPHSGMKGPLGFVCTDRNSGTQELLKELFPDMINDPVPSVVVHSQREVYDSVAANPLLLGLVSVAYMKSISRGDTVYGGIDSLGPVRAVPIETVDYSGHVSTHRICQASIYAGTYPLHYPLYLYLNESNTSLAAGFSSFLTSGAGQKIVQKFGLVPATMPVRLVQLNSQAR